ncbi:hypothetical protein VB636_07015, partial [Paracoccus sp. APAP_BH8]
MTGYTAPCRTSAFTRKVLAWRISNTLEADFCVEALNEAIHRFGAPGIMVSSTVANSAAAWLRMNEEISSPMAVVAQMGLFETYRIAGGEAGMRHFLGQFGPALKWPWTKLMEVPDLDEAHHRRDHAGLHDAW